jgi:hypothetical protein
VAVERTEVAGQAHSHQPLNSCDLIIVHLRSRQRSRLELGQHLEVLLGYHMIYSDLLDKDVSFDE